MFVEDIQTIVALPAVLMSVFIIGKKIGVSAFSLIHNQKKKNLLATQDINFYRDVTIKIQGNFENLTKNQNNSKMQPTFGIFTKTKPKPILHIYQIEFSNLV
eukprot:TRINITY_DN4128_c0_g1_i28.p3 TRINITY_DN4128_c0_g1~~TRINITY_DN4128_c0_g1_i28.p3  ORF type:complete len:102 (-),score=11.67 TRINITY_DN4128_c0_g1_i28:152-457(-)